MGRGDDGAGWRNDSRVRRPREVASVDALVSTNTTRRMNRICAEFKTNFTHALVEDGEDSNDEGKGNRCA